ncbi:MAG: diguanylate cyclase (GGDEF)-like protein [Clostridium sp.]|jgi:diguanylate cyclase (GGDEF)-like protein
MNRDTFMKNAIDPYIDSITGIRNKNYIIKLLQEKISNKDLVNYSLFLLDIDNFWFINDYWGYDFGNDLLKEIAEGLLNIIQNNAIVAYLGANSFIIINFEIEDIGKYAEEILNRIREEFILENASVNLTTSLGVYEDYTHEAYTYDGIIKGIQNADIALNKAKMNGKDCFVIFNDSIKWELNRKVKIQNNLRNAIKKDLMEIYYQPKIDTKNQQFLGMEALLRWNDDELLTISPSEFIPIAEEMDIIIELGRYVLKKVCIQIKNWEERGVNYINVAVNVSSKQFRDISLPDFITSTLKEQGLPPGVLELEVTESAIVENDKYSNKMFNEFIKKGIKIAIDDFGVGYSSYNQLSNLSFNTLKIDKSFIDFIDFDNKKSLIVKNMIDFAHILEMNVVAEGVEQEHQMKKLKEYGCDIIQGYYYSKPLCVHDLEEYIMKKGKENKNESCKNIKKRF